MPKATAVWLVDNTMLTFKQIAEFVGLHELEVQAIADGDVAVGMQGLDPVKAGAISAEELKRCEGDENTVLLPGDTLEISLSDLQNITELSEGLVKGN